MFWFFAKRRRRKAAGSLVLAEGVRQVGPETANPFQPNRNVSRPCPQGACCSQIAYSSASSARQVRSELETRQPTILRANASMTKATYTKPCHVAMQASETHDWLGRCAVKSRSTSSREDRLCLHGHSVLPTSAHTGL